MAKKTNKGGPPHLQSRVSYLYQAASYFAGLYNRAESGEQTSGEQTAVGQIKGQNSQQTPSPSSPHVVTQEIDKATGPSRATGTLPEGSSATYDDASIRLILSHIKGIARKGQVRVSPSIKRSVCKRCDILLIDGQNSTRRIENMSREGKKSWADVIVITCNSCGTTKRFPVGARRQPRRKDRSCTTKSSSHQGTSRFKSKA